MDPHDDDEVVEVVEVEDNDGSVVVEVEPMMEEDNHPPHTSTPQVTTRPEK